MARSAGAGRYERAGLARREAPARRDSARADGPARRRSGREAAPAAAGGVSALMVIFFAALLVPAQLHLGTLLLSPDRILLIVLFIPLALRLFGGKLGRLQPVDVFIALYCLWIAVAMVAVHGTERIEFIGITIVELFGGYMLGRALVRGEADYRAFFRCFAWALVLLLPLVLFEQATRRIVLSEFLDRFVDTYPYVNQELRWGLNRVQAVFQHPIGYGLFCSMAVANFYYLNQDRPARALGLTGYAIFMAFMSLSAAPMLSSMLQLAMIAWDKITRAKWALLAGIFVVGYVAIDLASNRTPPEVLASYLTFNPAAAYNRVRIWTYGWQNISANPIFGLGLNDWVRPWFMTPSIDNFWLLNAMRYGLPALVFLLAGIVSGLWRICARQGLSETERQCRTGYMVSITGLFFTLITVHVWGSMGVLVMFVIGAGVWMTEAGTGVAAEPARRRDRAAPDPDPAAAEAPAPDPAPPTPAARPPLRPGRVPAGATTRIR